MRHIVAHYNSNFIYLGKFIHFEDLVSLILCHILVMKGGGSPESFYFLQSTQYNNIHFVIEHTWLTIEHLLSVCYQMA